MYVCRSRFKYRCRLDLERYWFLAATDIDTISYLCRAVGIDLSIEMDMHTDIYIDMDVWIDKTG